jgi:ParB/RepB/Spo0J family partition protein
MTTAAPRNGHPKRKAFNIQDIADKAVPNTVENRVSELEQQLAEQLGVKTKNQEKAKANAAAELAMRPFPASKGSELLDLAMLVPSPHNPRKVFKDIESLAKSIAATGGLLVPIVARMLEGTGHYEIVAGERRFRALQLLKKQGLEVGEKALVDIRHLTDAQVAEAMMAENDQRDSLLPLEQADGYSNMLKTGHTPATIATKLGVSVGTVHARLKLLELSKRARKMLLDGPLTPSLATPLGRYPHELQDEALDRMLGHEGASAGLYEFESHAQGPKVLNVARCILWLQQHFTKNLRQTPFDTKSEELQVPAALWPELPKQDGQVFAPPCAICDYNSKNMPHEVAGDSPDGGSSGFCTRPPCFEAKHHAAIALLKAKAKESGNKVLTEGQSSKALALVNNHDSRSPYVRADDVAHEDPKKRTWGQLRAALNEKLDDGEQLRKVVATAAGAGTVDLVERDELIKGLAADGAAWAKKKVQPNKPAHNYKADVEREQRKQQARSAAAQRVLQAMVESIRAKGPTLDVMRALIEQVDLNAVPTERECELFGKKNVRELEAWAAREATLADLFALLYVRTAGEDYVGYYSGYGDEPKRAAKALKLDLGKLEQKELEAGAQAAER